MAHLLLSLPSSWVPRPLPRSCYSPQVSCTPDQVSDDEFLILHLHVIYHLRPSGRAAATLPANSDDEVPLPRLSHCTALDEFMVMLRFLSRAPVLLAFPPPPPSP
jgi:hypothetical protein